MNSYLYEQLNNSVVVRIFVQIDFGNKHTLAHKHIKIGTGTKTCFFETRAQICKWKLVSPLLTADHDLPAPDVWAASK